MPSNESKHIAELAKEWIEQLRATEPDEPWNVNLVDALVNLGKPAVPLLVEYLTDKDRTVVLGAAAAIERIARSLQQKEKGKLRCHHVSRLRKYHTS
jgi:hypothetical protein